MLAQSNVYFRRLLFHISTIHTCCEAVCLDQALVRSCALKLRFILANHFMEGCTGDSPGLWWSTANLFSLWAKLGLLAEPPLLSCMSKAPALRLCQQSTLCSDWTRLVRCCWMLGGPAEFWANISAKANIDSAQSGLGLG